MTAVVAAATAHNNHSPTLSTNSSAATSVNLNDAGEMMRKSGNGQHIVKQQQHTIVATAINPLAIDSTASNSMDARRKTRSAGEYSNRLGNNIVSF